MCHVSCFIWIQQTDSQTNARLIEGSIPMGWTLKNTFFCVFDATTSVLSQLHGPTNLNKWTLTYLFLFLYQLSVSLHNRLVTYCSILLAIVLLVALTPDKASLILSTLCYISALTTWVWLCCVVLCKVWLSYVMFLLAIVSLCYLRLGYVIDNLPWQQKVDNWEYE